MVIRFGFWHQSRIMSLICDAPLFSGYIYESDALGGSGFAINFQVL